MNNPEIKKKGIGGTLINDMTGLRLCAKQREKSAVTLFDDEIKIGRSLFIQSISY